MKLSFKLATIGIVSVLLVYLLICALLFLFQRSFIYFPTSHGVETPMFRLQRGDADVVVSTNSTKSSRAILYFGGNAEDVSQTIAPLSQVFPDATLYAMHYRSYGGSTGTPSEQALVADATELFKQVSKEHSDIIIIGRSLGSGIAIQVAASKPIERLVLITPYNSIAELAAEQFKLFPVQLILQDKYESWRYAGQISAPTTIIIAGNDQVIPNESSRKLAHAFAADIANVVLIPQANHNNVSDFPAYYSALIGHQAHEN